MTDLERAKHYLDQISPDVERAVWVKCLMAIKNTLGDDGEFLARGWSADSDKFDPQAFRNTWKSIAYDRNLTLGSLAHFAGHVPLVRQAKRSTQDYALTLWEQSEWGTVMDHPYAKRKGIDHDFGARRGTASGKIVGKNADCIIVPMRDWEWNLTGVECINAEGAKQTFGRKGVMWLGYLDAALEVHVCEGWATGFALSEMCPNPFAAIVAFGCSRLQEVGEGVVERHRGRVFIHHEENNKDAWDYWAEGKAAEYMAGIPNG